MAPDVAVLAEDVTKVFRLPDERRDRLKEHLVRLFRPVGHRELVALDGVSLDVRRGEFFSIVGSNGSGKSTLLKILAGIYRPTRGRVAVQGRLSPFIELGVGFNPELSARDNVFLNGVILGLDRRQVADQFDGIVEFAELERFMDLKLKNFSSGMLVRLGFSVAIRAHADVLLIDEVLAVGDAGFQQKCYDVFRSLRAAGKTIVFVSHDLASVKEFSDRVMLLDHGRVLGVHHPATAILEYQRLNEARAGRELARQHPGGPDPVRTASGTRIRAVDLLADDGEPARVIHRGQTVRVMVHVDNPARQPVHAGVSIYRSDGLCCFGTDTLQAGVRPGRCERLEVEVRFERIPLHRGSYHLYVSLFGETLAAVHDFREHVCDFQVAQWDRHEGLFHVEHAWRVRAASSQDHGD